MNYLKKIIRKFKNGTITDILNQLKWLLKLSMQYKVAVIIYTALGFSGVVVGLANSFISRDLIDIITGKQVGKLLTTFICMVLFTAGNYFISFISGLITRKVSLRIETNIKAETYDQIMSAEWEALTKFHSNELMVRWNGDSTMIANSVLTYFSNLCIALFRLLSALVVVLKNDASFAVIALLGMPFSFFVSKTNMKRMQSTQKGTMSASTGVSSFAVESFSNVQTVKAFDMLPFYSKNLRRLQDSYREATMRYQRTNSMNTLLMNLSSQLTTYVLYGWGIYRVWYGGITYGTMTMFLALSSQLNGTIQTLFSYIPTTITLTNSIKRYKDLSELPKEDFSQREEVAEFFDNHTAEGVGVSIRNASYTYATGTEVFNNVSFDAHPHEAIALVGPSGGGKTTMLRLVLALIRGQEGAGYITFGPNTPEDAKDMKELNPSCRQLFAYVPQGNTMFSGTIADNMRNVKENATDEEIIEALKIACAWDFVEKLPDGINTTLQEHGGGLSEGQAQRLSIARAIVRRSPILLLDEATSALDIETEHTLLRNIINDNYPRTTIVTTHRPSVLNSCKRVYSIRDKKCTELSQDEVDTLFSEFIKG